MSMAEDTRKRPDFSDNSPNAGNDPLAELARLIGQSDPFTDLGKRNVRTPLDSVRRDDRPAPEWLARPASSSDHDENDYGAQPVQQAYAPSYPAEHYDAPAQYQRPAQDDRYAPEPAAHDPDAYRDEHGE